MSLARKTLILRLALLVATAVSLYFVPWRLLAAWIRPLPATVEAQLEQTLGYGFDGVVVYVDRAGSPPHSYAAGYHDTAADLPARADALFKIASVGKLYGALAVAKLARAGTLALDGTLAHYLPEVAGRIEYADEITLRMLVQHRSGIANLTDVPGFWTDPPQTDSAALSRVFDLPASFAPGTDYAYSNSNYLLLDVIVERVTGRPHFDYVAEAILAPLGLEHTFGSLHDVAPDELMSGYYVGHEGDVKLADYGSMVATAADVGRFVRALNDGTAFTDEEERAIYASIYVFEHTGLIPGYQTIARFHPEADAVVVQFTNTTDFEGPHWSLSEIAYGRVARIVALQER